MTDIWRENGDYYRHLKNKVCRSEFKRGVVQNLNEGRSEFERKEEPLEEEPSLRKTTTTTAEKPKASTTQVVVFSLNELDVSEDLKKILSSQYSEEDINLAVKRTLAWEDRSCDEAALWTVLKRKDTWNDQSNKKDLENKNKEFLKSLEHLDAKTVGVTSITVGNKYIEFVAGMKVHTFEVDQKDFIEKTQNILEKWEILQIA
jgi:hypothetical protein